MLGCLKNGLLSVIATKKDQKRILQKVKSNGISKRRGPSWGPSLAMTPHQKSLISTPQRTLPTTLCGPCFLPYADPVKTLMKSPMKTLNGIMRMVHEDRCSDFLIGGVPRPCNGGLVMVVWSWYPPNGPVGGPFWTPLTGENDPLDPPKRWFLAQNGPFWGHFDLFFGQKPP